MTGGVLRNDEGLGVLHRHGWLDIAVNTNADRGG
jgi:hypothetical protein